ncbi:BatA domain-containing protein [Lutimonas sp.]|uniref:BatA domain-containing protein n=1 Tax=Lutimonas sp. TaxID=1872403 RepID=UPI003D9AB919
MQFKYPEVLFFLFLLLIPLLIHLFHLQRFKKEAFTNVKFLKEIELETRKSSKLKRLLILLSRLLAFAALIFAFAQPFINRNKNLQKKEGIYYFDNSFSMQAKSNSGLDQLQVNKTFLLDNPHNFESKTLVTNKEINTELDPKSFDNAVLKLDFHPVSKSINQVLLEIQNQVNTSTNTLYEINLISDFQVINKIIDTSLIDNKQEYNLIRPSLANQKNLSIDSIWVATQDAEFITLQADIRSHKLSLNDLSVSLHLNEELYGKTTIDIEANGHKNVEFKIPVNSHNYGKISISDQSLSFDNDLFFSIPKKPKTKVMAIGLSSDFLNRIYPEDSFELIEVGPDNLDQSKISGQSLIILNEIENITRPLIQSLNSFVSKGGSLVIIPANNLSIENYNLLLTSFSAGPIIDSFDGTKKINNINYDHPFFSKVFEKKIFNFQYPTISYGYLTLPTNSSPLLQYDDLSHFASETLFKKGKVYFISAPLSTADNNFSNSPLIVPLFYNFSKENQNSEGIYQIVGQVNHVMIQTKETSGDEPLKIIHGEDEFIPLQTKKNNKIEVITSEFPSSSGIYDFQYQDQIQAKVAYNYNRDESQLEFQSLASIAAEFDNIHLYDSIDKATKELNERTNNKNLWQLFIIFALVFLVLEILLQKFLKN